MFACSKSSQTTTTSTEKQAGYQTLFDGSDLNQWIGNKTDYYMEGRDLVVDPKRGYLKPVGEWNSQEVYVKGSKIKVTLNGTVILDGDLAEASKNGTVDHKEHPGLERTTGHIGFLGHGDALRFRNIRVLELSK